MYTYFNHSIKYLPLIPAIFLFVVTTTANNDPLKEKVGVLAQKIETFFESGLISEDLESFDESHVQLFANEMFDNFQEFEDLINSIKSDIDDFIQDNSFNVTEEPDAAIEYFVRIVKEDLPHSITDDPLYCYNRYEEDVYSCIGESFINGIDFSSVAGTINILSCRYVALESFRSCIEEKYNSQ